jgi:hypothetical protein
VVLCTFDPTFGANEVNMSSDEDPKTLSVPEAGRRYYNLSRNASYDAARRGEIPTIRIGRLLRVPVRACERILDEAATHLTKAKDSAELTGEAE